MKNLVAFSAALAISFLVGASLPASAHDPVLWFPQHWGPSHLTVNWRFADNVPTGAFRDRVKAGAQEWNSLNQTMSFQHDAGDYAPFSAKSCPSEVEKNGIHYGQSLAIVAGTILCSWADAGYASNNHLHTFQIYFNSGITWYTGVNSPPCGTQCQPDLWTVSSHEFGHATGRGRTEGGPSTTGGDGTGHFLNSWDVCTQTDSAHHTMCESGVSGKTWDRDLNTHDKDTFNAQY